MNTMWLDEPPMYGCRYSFNENNDRIPPIKYWRRTELVDFGKLDQLTRMKTCDMFGDVDPERISEKSCLSLVQINDVDEVVTNISLCNYPNIPSIPSNGWLEWMYSHYGIQGITERNTLFVHMLLWDTRYNDEFFKSLLDAVFISSIHTSHVIFVMPPLVTPVGFVEEHMTRIVPSGQTDSYRIQALYISLRHMHCPRLKIRRVVEEDNDDIIPILDRESLRFRELYGEFYISEMMRYPDGLRQMVVAEVDGLATGVLCLNKIVDVQSLKEHFELGPYHGLQKPHPSDDIHGKNELRITSDILFLDDDEAARLEKNDHFKHKSFSKTSAPDSVEEIDRDFSDQNDTEPESLSSDDVDARGEALKNPVMNEESVSISKLGIEINEKDESGMNGLVGIIRASVSRASESRSVAEDAMHQRSPDSAIDTPSTTSANSNSRSVIRDPDYSGAGKRSSAIQSKVRMSVDIKDDVSSEEDSSSSQDVPVEINSRIMIRKKISRPVYHGETNAFTLELFSMREDVDERLSYDYLEAVFECFPDEDYCVVLIPPSFPTFPLLQSFVRVPLRFNKDYPLVLYLAHRATVIGDLRIREVDSSDMIAAEELLADVPKRSQVLKDLEHALQPGSSYVAYIFLCQETMVGLAVLCVERDIEFIRSHYQIDDFICFDRVPMDSHARIVHLVIMPIFASLHRYFFQELMHTSDKLAMYYRLYHKEASALTRAEPLVTFLGEMIPVPPRRKLKYCLDNYPENPPADFVLREAGDNFSLYMMVPRVASTPKIDVNVRVVVVGASDCGLSLLETIVFGPSAASINFTNITLISPNGIPFENRPDDVERDELPFRGRYCRDYRQLIGTRVWINVVHGTMTAINRKDKFVTVSSMGSLSYDYLVLTCGLQYQRPKFYEELKAEERGEFCAYEDPQNCLTINTEREAANFSSYCRRVFADNPSCSVIIYGENISSYCALAMLIESAGLTAENITLIEPALKTCESRNTTFFGNVEVEDAVHNAIKESGVSVLSEWDLVNWVLEKDGDVLFVKEVILEQKGERRKLDCDVLVNFKEKTINQHTFLAICRSGLVFDGSLVIDPEFHTNDPCIFAAGTITKYSRRFYADEFSHKYQNPLEVGERLGQKLRNLIDPRNVNEEYSPPQKQGLDMTLPVSKKPIIKSCRLPGGYNYLHVGKPGKSATDDINDVVLITGYPASVIGYFRLHLNQFDSIETITCLSKEEFEVENYISLYGKHQTLLNDLKIRFQKSMVPDFYAYFREPWAVALFLDKFECLRVENRATLLSSTVVCGDTLINDCTRALVKSKWEAMTPEDRELIETRYAGSVYQEELENSLVDFLQYSEAHLPMYCNPRFLRQFLDDVELLQDDPLFKLNETAAVASQFPNCTTMENKDIKMLKSMSPRLSPRDGEPRIIRLTTDQEAVLQEQFNRCPRAPHTADIVLLAAETGLSEADVQGWYAVRLAQWRKEQGLGGNLHFSN